jgi:hypothetical protein
VRATTILRLVCECGNNVADVDGQQIEPDGAVLFLRLRGGSRDDKAWRPAPPMRPSRQTFTQSWRCRCGRRHSVARDRLREAWLAVQSEDGRVVRRILGRDL